MDDGHRRTGIGRDVLAGLTLAAMSIPQVLGYTRIAGTPVVTGLYTLVLPLIAFAALGSSRYLVVAADSATAAILAGALAPMAPVASERYVGLAGLVALQTAAFLVVARLLSLGFLADFLSQTVLIGFLAGVGVQVGTAVFGEMLALPLEAHGTLAQLAEVLRRLPAAHVPTAAIAGAVVAAVVGIRALAPRFPGPLLAVVAAVAASAAFDFAGLGIAVVGAVPSGLPPIGLPHVELGDVARVLPVAASCFVMIVAQSAAAARAYADRHRDPLDENADLVGLAAANAAAAVSGTFVVNGSPTQTAMLEAAGGRSHRAHLTAAAVVVLVLAFVTGPLAYLPRCVLGAIVFTIALGLIDLRGLRAVRRESPGEYRLALTTAAVVVAVGVEQGILLAMGLSLLRHVRHSYHPHTSVLVEEEGGHWRTVPAAAGTLSAPGLLVFRFGADLFYANARRFAEDIRRLVAGAAARVEWLVLDAGAITSIDYSAARVLRSVRDDLARDGILLVVVHASESLQNDLERHRVLEAIGPQHVFDTLREAVAVLRRPSLDVSPETLARGPLE